MPRSAEPEEAVLAGDVARCVEGLDPDVVEVDGPVDRGARVRLGDDEQLAVTGPGLGRRAEAREGRRSGGVVAQQPEARSGHRVQDRLAAIVAEDVLAVTEEGEVVGGQPVEESHPLGHLGAIDACRRCGAQPVADLDAPLTHLRPVLDGVADVAEQALQLGGQRVSVGRVAHPVDLDVHPRLDPDTEFARRSLVDVEDLLKHATSIPADDQLRVNEQVDAQAPAGQRHSHRVDEERHVVDDDLDRRVPRTHPATRPWGCRRARSPCRPADHGRGRGVTAPPPTGLPGTARAGPPWTRAGSSASAKAQRDPRNPSEPSPQRCAARCRETAQARWSW